MQHHISKNFANFSLPKFFINFSIPIAQLRQPEAEKLKIQAKPRKTLIHFA
jgi:hypothetical protein